MLILNSLLRSKFNKYTLSMSKSKDAYGPLLYSIVNELVERNIIVLRLHIWPKVGLGHWGTVKGGLRYSRNDMKLIVWMRPGLEIEPVFDNIFPNIFKRLMACILSEGVCLYNKKNNGELLSMPQVTEWYTNYFAKTMMETTRRTTASRLVAKMVAEKYAKSVFQTLEKPIMAGRQPDLVEKKDVGMRTTLLKSGKLIKIYAVTLLSEIIKNDLPRKLNIDVDTSEAFLEYRDALAELVEFVYENRELEFDPQSLAAQFTISDTISLNIKKNKYDLGKVASVSSFDNAYDETFGLKNVYEKGKFFKKNFVFNELYMPSSILAKKMYYMALEGTDFEGGGYQIANAAIKGLGYLL